MLKAIALKKETLKNRWIKIGVTGVWEGHMAGRFEMNEETYTQMVENFERLGLDIVVDYEHQTLYGEKAPAAGWIKHPEGLKVENGELFAKIEWTQTAKEHIEKKEYRYLSPTFKPNTTDPKTGADIGWSLHSVAMTNTPFLSDIDPVANKNTQTNKEEEQMSKALQEQIDALQQTVDSLKKENDDLKKEVEDHRKIAASAAVEEAIAAKKLSPEQKAWGVEYALRDKAGFDAFIKNAKPYAEKPADDLYANSQNAGQGVAADEIDMTKI